MLKKINKILSSLAIFSSFVPLITSCSNPAEEFTIYAPSNKNSNCILQESQKDVELKFYGFSFNFWPEEDKEEVTVQTTFELLGSNISCHFADFNKELKTFDIVVKIVDCKPVKNLSGKFIFKVGDKTVKFTDELFYINITDTVTIKHGSQKEAAAIIKGLDATTTFNSFSFNGVFDQQDLECTFKTNSLVQTKCKIVNFSQETKSFDVELTITGADPNTTVAGEFVFKIYGNEIEFTGKTIEYLVNISQDKSIIESINKTINVFCKNGTVSEIKFTNFYFAGISESSEITVKSYFKNSSIEGETKELTASIVDFDHSKQVFSIQISGITHSDAGKWEGYFEFSSEGKQLLKTNNFVFNLYYVIDENLLNVEDVVEEGVKYITLKGIKDGSDITKFDSILIPKNVQKINANAFSGVFATDKEASKNIKHLFFDDNCALTSIDDGAFANCTSLTGDVILPRTFQKIGKNAFSGCSNLNETLSIPDTGANMLIDTQAFANCQFTKLNIETYNPNILPDWNTSSGNDIFTGWQTVSSNRIIICQRSFNDETFKTNLMNHLITKYSFPSGWQFEKSEERY